MKKKVNLFQENDDILFHINTMVDWNSFVPLLEHDFDPEHGSPYTSVEEAVDFYKEVLTLVGEMAGTSIMPRAKEIDKEGHRFVDGKVIYHPELEASVKELADSGLHCMEVERKYDGQNMSSVVLMLTTELLSNADGSIMTVFALTDGVAETIERFGDEETKKRIIAKLVTGEYQGSMALTEDNAGSDLGGIVCKAFKKDGQWFVNGTKKFITNAPAKICLALVRTDEATVGTTKGLSLVMVELDERVEIISLEDKIGLKGSPTCMMVFKDAPATMLGEENNGFKEMLTLMNMARLGVAAQATGIAQAALTEAQIYATERKQFGVAIDHHPLVQDLLTQMMVSVEAMRSLVVKTAAVADMERGYRLKLESMSKDDPDYAKIAKEYDYWIKNLYMFTPLTKYWAAEQAVLVTSQAIQVMGGNGYVKDYPLERFYRDARVTPIYEGTTEIQVLFAMRSLIQGGQILKMLDGVEKFCIENETAESGEGGGSGEFVYSLDSAAFGDEGAKKEQSLCGKLKQCKEWLVDAGQIMLGSFMDTKNDQYLRLRARDISELGVIVFVGHEFMLQAQHSERKAKIASRWITDNYPRARALHERIESMDKSIIENFEVLSTGKN